MPDNNEIWYFEDVNLYQVLCPHRVKRLREQHTYTHFQKNQFIYFPDEPSRYIFLIFQGRVKIGSYSEDGRELVKAILGKGEVFGELALTGEAYRSDYAMALDDDTVVCQLTIEEMHELMKENQPLSFAIFKLIGFRIRKLERKIEGLVFKDARTRIIDFLQEMASERGQKIGYETLIKTQFTHKDIANLTGTSRQTVTTVLNELKEKNVLTFDRRRILIRDLALLA
ncbi:cAMP-binding domain of CRP or a regulatory subunit of cAMP-dependent protein kinases [Catalinimonas alkaloidigena]|uniref:cAMP-binding domain of CRP or a regulatory subunit of cAMP-dependent protein kinases n=1 Tax=Catalinimonas alkaloidigena TaxID=1075417 RepID=A0A1G8Y181_9BACT|nr:Crp/Fnr family transcriptional regulator [Catalinimonas alkaloidigena]SDJ96204.1 cAMP-binding domain of CRP or a regulatory subunit of cAMP-dependent protein kinases [Catalinimonas alkaloidigena]